MSGRRLSIEEKLSVVNYYNEGKSQREVADKFHIGVDYVRSIVKQYGILRSSEENNKLKGMPKIQFSKEEIGIMREFYQYNSLEKVAKKFNVSVDTIVRIFKENNIFRNAKDTRDLIVKTRQDKIREEYPFEDIEVISFYQDHSVEETKLKFHINLKLLKEVLNRNGLDLRTQEESNNMREKHNIEKYGVKAPIQAPEIWEKKTNTTMERYGVPNVGFLPEVKEKREITCELRYGDKVPSKTKEIKEKTEITNLKKFGVKSILCLKEPHITRKKNNIKKFGGESPFSSPEVFAKAKRTMGEKYGKENTLEIPELRSKQSKSAKKSSLETRFEEFLINNNLNYVHGYMIEGTPYNHEFDFAIFDDQGNLDILIDCDGKYYHGYENDEDGKKVNTYIDDYRSSLVPEGVKFLICLEGEEEKAYKEILYLVNIDYDQYIQDVFNWCREIEFPYPKYKDKTLENSYSSLLKSDTNKFSMNARYGMKIIDHFHLSIWKANKKEYLSPYDAWKDDNLLLKSIKNRIIYKGCNLDRSKVLAGFSIAKVAPKISLFNPYLAKYIVNKYLSQHNEIFDPCSGYSGRMLGICSLGKKYIGQDINPITVEESNKIIKYFNLNALIECKDSLGSGGDYECLFTCTPYSDKENWNQKIDNRSCDEWIDEILNKYDCKEYIFVVDKTEKYSQYIVEELDNKSHFNKNKEYIIIIKKTDLN